MKNRDKKSISDTVSAPKCQSFLYSFRRFVPLFICLGCFEGCRLCALGPDAAFAVLMLPRSSRRPPNAAEKEKPRGPGWREMTGRGHRLVAQPTAGHVHAGEAHLSH